MALGVFGTFASGGRIGGARDAKISGGTGRGEPALRIAFFISLVRAMSRVSELFSRSSCSKF